MLDMIRMFLVFLMISIAWTAADEVASDAILRPLARFVRDEWRYGSRLWAILGAVWLILATIGVFGTGALLALYAASCLL